jgi:hypothetical protein
MESEEKADISTLEKTGHLYFAPTCAASQLGFPICRQRLRIIVGSGLEGGITFGGRSGNHVLQNEYANDQNTRQA